MVLEYSVWAGRAVFRRLLVRNPLDLDGSAQNRPGSTVEKQNVTQNVTQNETNSAILRLIHSR